MKVASTPVAPPGSSVAAQGRRPGFRLLTTPAMAFLISFPTIGYYTFALYVNAFAPEGSIGAILVRAVSLALLLFAWILVPRLQTRRLGGILLPATVFFLLYSGRLLENMMFLDIQPGNLTVVLIFFTAAIIPAFVLASMERVLRDGEMISALSIFSVLFVIGITLNSEALIDTAEYRLALDKINPIALAYVASSLVLFYLLSFAQSKRLVIEALVLVPILLLIISLARSRGMIISTGVTLIIYVMTLRGTRRIWALFGLSSVVAIIVLFANPEYAGYVTEAISRIDASDTSTAMRVLSYSGAWQQFLDDPFFGRYVIEQVTAFYPHNIYLESLMAVGLIGTIPFAIHVLMACRAAIGVLREKERSFARMFVGLLFIRDAIGAAGSGSLWGVPGFWITSFLIIVMWYGRRRGVPRPSRLLYSPSRLI